MRTGTVVLAVVLAGTLVSCGGEPDATPRGPGAAVVTSDRLDFSVTTFEGEKFTLSDHRGTPVVLNFWESW